MRGAVRSPWPCNGTRADRRFGLARDLAAQPTPAGPEHPWTGRTFSAGCGTEDTLDVDLVLVLVSPSWSPRSTPTSRWTGPAADDTPSGCSAPAVPSPRPTYRGSARATSRRQADPVPR
ncbi:hypothetical protein [Streptomyces purpurogeneiscleroticus]|uniref:hypothetical protein n=1 Tax=Streptomyces purpurogeneiscleroticus TaxID=68259 RepID=UPI001CC08860|nr:hypothetical protein [Streptomyces purpurogeneiscleroticus]